MILHWIGQRAKNGRQSKMDIIQERRREDISHCNSPFLYFSNNHNKILKLQETGIFLGMENKLELPALK